MPKRKISPALRWIIREAKKLKREYPKRFNKWTEYVAQASAIYAKKHGGKSPVGHKHKLTGMRKRKRSTKKRKTIIKRVKRLHRAEGRAIRRLGSIGKARQTFRKQLQEQLAWGLFSADQARTKRAKKKIRKRLAVVKRKLKIL